MFQFWESISSFCKPISSPKPVFGLAGACAPVCRSQNEGRPRERIGENFVCVPLVCVVLKYLPRLDKAGNLILDHFIVRCGVGGIDRRYDVVSLTSYLEVAG